MDTQHRFLPTGPSLQIPKPTQPHHDSRYHHLLETRTHIQPTRHSIPASTNPSPSTTLCSSSSGKTLALDEEMKKAHENWLSVTPGKGYHPTAISGSTKRMVQYEYWMLNHEAAAYAPLFPPINFRVEPQVEEGKIDHDEQGQTYNRDQIPLPTCRYPPRRQPTAPYRRWHPHKPWSEFFDKGCRNRDRDARTYYARMIVRSQRWDDDADKLLALVQTFVLHAVDVNGDAMEREHIGSFASLVREAFRCASDLVVPKPSPTLALNKRFKELMKDTVLSTFINCWDNAPENRNAITYPVARAPSSSYLNYVTSALHLCSFIADLYLEKFLSRPETVGCVRTILYNLSLVDHITAIEKILRRAGTALWRESATVGGIENLDKEMEDFEAQMWRVLQNAQDYGFLLAGRGEQGDLGSVTGIVEGKVEGLVKFVRQCRKFVCEGKAADGIFLAIGPER